MATLYAGAARRLINPELGMRSVGFSSREGLIQAIQEDLTVTALVLAEEAGKKVAILACDLCVIPHDVMRSLRQRVAEALDTTPAHVMVNMSHTHSGPNVGTWLPDDPAHRAAERGYTEKFLAQAVGTAADAAARLQPARIAAGWGESHQNINRREKDGNGRVFLGENPEGPVDHSVGVIRVDDLEGRPIAITFSYGCHTVVVGPRSLAASPDFPGPARHLIESTFGGLSLFLQACGGDIMPQGGMGYEVDCTDANTRFGYALGAEVVRVASGLRTHVRRGDRTSLSSLATITLWPWVPVDGESLTALDAADVDLELSFVELPSLETAEALRDERVSALAEAKARYARDAELNIKMRFADWGNKLVEAVKTGRHTLEMPIQVIRINDVVLVGLGVEAFAETGLRLKADSPFAHTQVLGYTNGCVAYLPPEKYYPEGGWDVRNTYGIPDLLFQAYSLPVAIAPDSESRAVDCARALLEQVE